MGQVYYRGFLLGEPVDIAMYPHGGHQIGWWINGRPAGSGPLGKQDDQNEEDEQNNSGPVIPGSFQPYGGISMGGGAMPPLEPEPKEEAKPKENPFYKGKYP